MKKACGNNKVFLLFLILVCNACLKGNELYYQQYFIENITDERFQFKAFLNKELKHEFIVNPNRRVFIDGFVTTGEFTSVPIGVSSFRADSIVIILQNGKKWIDVCYPHTNRWPMPCYSTRGLFNNQSYVRTQDKGRISYYNHTFRFDENDAESAK
ncbi:hypothetical protein [Emticicia agri]|uniref:Uncharacterized protein n=1 Tax=Emticicia agri TaxID=2492393 RepID=A0A4Q5LWW0_9BACT|nr:hypothetical protein [Emticicia agri]RYU93983.1 hypothetical protein EWM59_19075 [Emticicia agri]